MKKKSVFIFFLILFVKFKSMMKMFVYLLCDLFLFHSETTCNTDLIFCNYFKH